MPVGIASIRNAAARLVSRGQRLPISLLQATESVRGGAKGSLARVRDAGELAAGAHRHAPRRRSPLHAARHEFEQRVGQQLQAWCPAASDVISAVGDTSGAIPRCKVGDFVVTMGSDSAAVVANIVVEAKASGVCTLKATLEEADVARRNRAASVCLFVHSAQTAPAGLPELHRWGHDIVVVWDAEDPATDVRLKAGFLLAKALCQRARPLPLAGEGGG